MRRSTAGITELTLELVGEIKLTCENPGGHVPAGKAGHPTFPFTFEDTRPVPSSDFTTETTCDSDTPNNDATAMILFTFNFPPDSKVKCKLGWTNIGSELITSVAATATWSCTGFGPQCEMGDLTIEVVRTECTNLLIDEPESDCFRQGDDDLQHVGGPGQPPPSLPDDD